jgi:hypothetical protein
LFSDIHGNPHALQAVLPDIDLAAIERTQPARRSTIRCCET